MCALMGDVTVSNGHDSTRRAVLLVVVFCVTVFPADTQHPRGPRQAHSLDPNISGDTSRDRRHRQLRPPSHNGTHRSRSAGSGNTTPDDRSRTPRSSGVVLKPTRSTRWKPLVAQLEKTIPQPQMHRRHPRHGMYCRPPSRTSQRSHHVINRLHNDLDCTHTNLPPEHRRQSLPRTLPTTR